MVFLKYYQGDQIWNDEIGGHVARMGKLNAQSILV